MKPAEKVTVSVHERLDRPGYVVQVSALRKVAKFPCPTFEEATALAKSVRGYVEAGCPVEALLGLDSEGEA
jgi:hypothetical protein